LGVQNAITPSACDAWLTALARYGTMTLSQVLAPALELASDGFPVSRLMSYMLTSVHDNIRQWPSSSDYLRPDGTPFQSGDVIRQPLIAKLFETLIDEERAAALSRNRADAIMAARDLFYKGDLAEKMARFSQSQGGFLDYDDLANFSVKIEPPAHTTYRGYDVYSCGPWCQGPVLLQSLNILENFDMASLGHNSPEALHRIIESLKASFADRHAYYGDPDFVEVPMKGLLDKGYARHWAERIGQTAWNDMPAPGDPWSYEGKTSRAPGRQPEPNPGPPGTDTSYLCVVDAEGNGFSATPSDGVRLTPIVPEVGVVLSPRGYQSWLDPRHPSSLQPGKRPRLTPSPALMLKDGKLAMTFGTPGLDVQPQAMTQLVLNVVDFKMDPQSAIEQPRVATFNFPASQHPHHYTPGMLCAEGRIPDSTLAGLTAKGHHVTKWPDFVAAAGALCAICVDSEYGPRVAGADPRRTAYAVGW
jgi:gamma-glutamyltranspeptidase/glutathione hydrolase